MPASSAPASLVGCSSTLTVGVSLFVPLPGLGELCRADGRNEERVANIWLLVISASRKGVIRANRTNMLAQ